LPTGVNPFSVKAFEILVSEHHRSILSYALSLAKRPEVAEDLAQESFITAFQKIETFDTTQDFPRWVRGIVRNKYRDWVRSHGEVCLAEEVLEAIDGRFDAWEAARRESGEDLTSLLRGCLAELAESMRQVVELFYFQDRTCLHIAEVTGVNVVTVKKRLQRGRDALGECIERRKNREVKS
jgi:RNA polymerase sigma-70 factor (ECF subfamily)